MFMYFLSVPHRSFLLLVVYIIYICIINIYIYIQWVDKKKWPPPIIILVLVYMMYNKHKGNKQFINMVLVYMMYKKQ